MCYPLLILGGLIMQPQDKKLSNEVLDQLVSGSNKIATAGKETLGNISNALDQCIQKEDNKNEKMMRLELQNAKAAISTPTTVPVDPKVAKEVAKGLNSHLKTETEQSAKLKQGPDKPEAEQSSSLYKTPTLKR